jgi:hypothetical protein
MMRWTATAGLVLAAAGVAAGTAIGAQDVVRPGKGGKVSLGMTRPEVHQALGRPVYVRRIARPGVGRALAECAAGSRRQRHTVFGFNWSPEYPPGSGQQGANTSRRGWTGSRSPSPLERA